MEAKTLQIITNELYKYGKLIKEEEIKEVVDLCQKANRIFIAGAGRSGFAARGFANRMMHLGFTVYFVGETTTPSIQAGDLLIVGSGSGKQQVLSLIVKKQKHREQRLQHLRSVPKQRSERWQTQLLQFQEQHRKCRTYKRCSDRTAGRKFI